MNVPYVLSRSISYEIQEAMRTGVCGPDANSLTRPGILGRNDDRRPEPAYRLHLTDRTMLHHL